MAPRSTILDYGVAPAYFGWREEQGACVLQVPPAPLWILLPRLFAPLFIEAVIALLCTGIAVAFSAQSDGFSSPLFSPVGVLLSVTGITFWFILIRGFASAVRSAQRPTIIRATGESLEINMVPGAGNDRHFWAREAIVDLRAVPGGLFPSLQQYLHLWVTTRSGQRVSISIPWPKGVPMAQVEDNLRDVPALPGT